MSGTQRNFDHADQSEIKEKSRFDVIRLGDVEVTRATYEPGWTWKKYTQPTVGGASCQETHRWYVVSGSLGMRMDDGAEFVWNPGDLGEVPPGHDAWVIGDEPFVVILIGASGPTSI
jgi:mannose-6-phosphate isomerase-like protein (cupin superfamily)